MPKKTRRKKHIPQRTCVGCHEVLPKRSLIRVVRGPDGVQIDPTGKMAGRGAYLHDRRSCWENGIQGALARALRAELTQEECHRLESYAESLADEDQPPAGAPSRE